MRLALPMPSVIDFVCYNIGVLRDGFRQARLDLVGEIHLAKQQCSIMLTSRSCKIRPIFENRTACEQRCASVGALLLHVFYSGLWSGFTRVHKKEVRSFYA